MNLLDTQSLNWVHYTGGDKYDYPISYWGALINARDDGHIDLLFRWDPGKYCHFHTHFGETTSTVLAGELHVTDFEDGKETCTKIRRAGDYAHKGPGDVHMEKGGPEGALVLFSIYSKDGRLAQRLNSDGTAGVTTTIDDMKRQFGV